jgi:hypothetical protein
VDLPGRRHDLGATIKEMVDGLGMSVADGHRGKERALQAANREARRFDP